MAFLNSSKGLNSFKFQNRKIMYNLAVLCSKCITLISHTETPYMIYPFLGDIELLPVSELRWHPGSCWDKGHLSWHHVAPSPGFWDLLAMFSSLHSVFPGPWLLHAAVSVPARHHHPYPPGPSILWELSSTSMYVKFFCKESGLFSLLYVFTH